MKISTRIFFAYVVLSMLLGGATLAAGYYSLQTLVEGIVTEDVKLLAREIGLFMLPRGRIVPFDQLDDADRRALQEQVGRYVIRSDRVASLQIIGNDGTILVANDRKRIGGRLVGQELAEIHAANPSMKPVQDSGGGLYEITVPIMSGKDRLGTLRARIRPKHFTNWLDGPRQRFLAYFIALVVLITLSGVAVASVFTVPVRRLNRALIDIQKKHFRGATLQEEGDVAGALRAVSQMGEGIEAMARGARRQEMALTSLSRALDEGVAILDVTGRVVTANPAAAGILRAPAGLDPAAAVASVLEASADVGAIVQEALTSDGDVTGRDVQVALPEGRRAGVRLSAYVLRDPDRPAGVLLILRDLASIRTFEQDLQEASRLSVLARLTASVAHEIKNPLNSMVINMEVLRGILDSLPADVRTESERYVTVVTEEIYRLDEVIRDFLGLTNPSDLTTHPADVNVLVGKVVDLIRYEAHMSHVRIDLALGEDLPLVPAVPVRLTQAFLNVSLNAIQAMNGGGTLTIRTRREGDAICVDFEDTGPGIPFEIRDKIFDFHFTTKKVGTGLGLSITRLILEAQGGSIGFRSDPGKGSVFTIQLPVRAPVAMAS